MRWGVACYYKTANTSAPHFITHVPTVNCTMLVVLCLFLCFLAHDHIHALSHHDGVSRCIAGPLHKDTPSPEGPEYVECLSWKENSCCTANFTAELQKNRLENLYNFSWNHCGNLTQVGPARPQHKGQLCFISVSHTRMFSNINLRLECVVHKLKFRKTKSSRDVLASYESLLIFEKKRTTVNFGTPVRHVWSMQSVQPVFLARFTLKPKQRRTAPVK